MKTSLHSLYFLGGLILAQVALGQATLAPVGDVTILKRKEVADAVKSVGVANAAELARLNVNPASTRPAELQVSDQLREVSYWLANERHPRAVEAALAAIGEAEKARGRIAPADEAQLLVDNGRSYELIVGDVPKAKVYYQNALKLQGSHVEASRALARIERLERVRAEKARENEQMFQRRQTEGKRS